MKILRSPLSFSNAYRAPLSQWLNPNENPWSGVFHLLNELVPTPALSRPALALDVYEDAENLYARIEVPGVKKEDLQVQVKDSSLTLTARRQLQADNVQTLSRILTLPETVQTDAIQAALADGILTVTLPKKQETQARLIAVN